MLKRISFLAAVLLCSVASAMAGSIDEFFDKVKASFEFSAVAVPKEQAKEQGFDQLDVAISESLTPAAAKSLQQEASLLPKTQLMTEVAKDDKYVSIFTRPLSGGKAQILLVVIQGKEGAVVKGICSQEMVDNQLKDLHMNNIFGN